MIDFYGGNMKKLFQEQMKIWLYIPTKKRENLKAIFSHIAPKYNFATALLSFCQDSQWKKQLINNLDPHTAPTCVDLACGTGDLTFLLAQRYAKATVMAVDLSLTMLEIAQARNHYSNIKFINADMGNLTMIPTNSVDVVTGGYALRNAADLSEALNEIQRILKPGGTATFLEFSKTVDQKKQGLQYGLLKTWGSLCGILLHANYKIYAYLAESLKAFPDRDQLRNAFISRGFLEYKSTAVLGGMLEIIHCKKGSNASTH